MEKARKKWLDNTIPSLIGKNVLITGGTSGIGYEAAFSLAYRGAHVYIACRNKEKASQALCSIQKEIPGAQISFLFYDQSSPDSIRSLSEQSKDIPFDSIVLNAGIYYPKKGEVASDGTSLTFMTNAVGTYLVFSFLYPFHRKSRFVFVNSVANKTPDGGTFAPFFKSDFGGRGYQYEASKRAVMTVFGYALSCGDVDAVMTHPGITQTGILRDFAPWLKRAGNRFMYLFSHKPWKACLGIVYLAANKGRRGDYVVPRGLFHFSGYPKTIAFPKQKVFSCQKDLIESMRKNYGI